MTADLIDSTEGIYLPVENKTTDENKKRFKKEIVNVFKKFGYLNGDKDYEVTFKTTSGNIAWINIKRIETIK